MSAAVLEPGSAAYEAVRRPAMARFADVRPAAIVRCASAAEVVEALALGRGRRIAVRSGGHCFAGRSSTDGVLIDVGPMNAVEPHGDVVRVGAGARLGRVYDALDAVGRTIAGGCGPQVGIAGLTLGGGLGVLGRTHGLTCDQLLAAQVVLADGRVVRCDERTEPDLLWALRGAGGGQFGVVCELTLRTVPAPPAVTVFHLRHPLERAAELIDRWQRLAPDAPDPLAASLLCNGRGVHVFGAHAGPREEAEALLAPLGEPAGAVVEELPWRAAKGWLAEHGPGDGPPDGLDFAASEFFREPLPAEAVAALADQLERGLRAGHHCELDLMPWGGAYGRVAPTATAFPHRDARVLLKQAVVVAPGADPAPARAWLRRSYAVTHPHGTGGAYVNFPDLELEDPLPAYHGANLARLRELKARYDPDGVFAFPQSL
jgi:FAD/FMN-containing dehydrogenase